MKFCSGAKSAGIGGEFRGSAKTRSVPIAGASALAKPSVKSSPAPAASAGPGTACQPNTATRLRPLERVPGSARRSRQQGGLRRVIRRVIRYALLASLALLPAGSAVRGAAFVPADDHTVLERIRTPAGAPVARELRALRARLAQAPADLRLAVEVAQAFLSHARAEADPRGLGYAQAALAPWWNLSNAPAPVLVLRATIRQSNHEFTPALADLDHALQLNPADAQAWLTRATILQVLGRYDEARRACLPLARLASALVATTCASAIASLSGQADQSYAALRRAVARDDAASVPEKSWALTVLAEIAERCGMRSEAEDHFRAALALSPRDPYLLGAYADLLLDQQRGLEAIAWLRAATHVDALLLRLCLAEQSSPHSAGFGQHLAALGERFAANRNRGNKVHQREEARFELHLRGHPAEALRLARENWAVQREPADARVLLEAAIAARAWGTVAEVEEWLRAVKLEDVRLTTLLAQSRSAKTNPVPVLKEANDVAR